MNGMITWNTILYALGLAALVSILLGLFKGKEEKYRQRTGLLSNFLLADRSLNRSSLIQLLFSTSFSLNGMLYQAWLGFSIGLWALLIQLIWALSYVLLAKYVVPIRASDGLHEFLGEKFGPKIKWIAGICSIVGTLLLTGWEFNVGRSTFMSIVTDHTNLTTPLMFIVVVICLIYTVAGGLRGNAISNTFQNFIKLLVFLILIFLLIKVARSSMEQRVALDAFFPSLSTMINNLGVWGLITNIAFSLAWQFIDVSTWQNIVGSAKKLSETETKLALRLSGVAVFVAPGIVGTILGALLYGNSNVTSDNIIASVLTTLGSSNPALNFLVVCAIFFAIMSTIDGLVLAAGYAFVCDILYRHTSIDNLDEDEQKSRKVLVLVRFVLLASVLLGTLGVYYMNAILKIQLFDLTYIMVIAQLTLFGPVIIGLGSNHKFRGNMNIAIYISLFIGFGAYLFGRLIKSDFLMNGAGLFALISSWITAKLLFKSSY